MPIATILLLVALLAPYPALAYLDPGTGSLLMQAIVGAIAALALFFRGTWVRIWQRVRGRKNPPPGPPPAEPG